MDSGASAEKPGTANCFYSGQDIVFDSGPSSSSGHDSNRSASFKRRSRGELASRKCSDMFRFPARPAAMIRIDTIWLAIEPMDMRAGTETALARVVAVFGAAKPHCAYLFANRRANRMKVLVHDGVGIWLAARRLNQGRFFWPGVRHGSEVELDAEQLQALVLGLPWQRVGSGGAITVL
ncbi:IS66 family insertion sequence element accessory protein TnpB [Pseudomonas rhodesiae]|uniref:IS66 family insertion sequence element accessory protein TnpB n=1 Tax=Pseudomonas rhodesiae TaxID=76760 RepID=UPI0027347EC9|nr:IS66 family insertion sequence element accessory protein TnpB [Pseudomonas rhodesiae]WLI28040.1 IS66 family insertion sequence element accessory protein TnpB [Pseudomonas rhodesiae]